MMRRRRPVMRGAMVAGGAYAVGRSGQKKKQAAAEQDARISQLEAQQAAAAPAPPPAAAAPAPPAAGNTDDMVEQLTKLKGLLDAGVLTQAEFDAQKAKILAG